MKNLILTSVILVATSTGALAQSAECDGIFHEAGVLMFPFIPSARAAFPNLTLEEYGTVISESSFDLGLADWVKPSELEDLRNLREPLTELILDAIEADCDL